MATADKTSKHTAGPWHRNIYPATKYPIIFAGRNKHIARVISDGLSEEEVEANTNLIVSAPAMRTALHEALAFVSSLPPSREQIEVLRVIRAALAKENANAV